MIIRTHDDGAMPAFVQLPAVPSGAVVLVLHENLGLNDHIRGVCGWFAAEGFVAVAPDLFWRMGPGIELGYTEADLDRAFDIYQRLDTRLVAADVDAAVRAMRAAAWCTAGVGAVGFGLGGRLAAHVATTGLIDAAIGYYGVGIDRVLALAPAVACPLMLHFGTEDRLAPPAVVDRIEAHLASTVGASVHRYPGADHGFNCDARAAYHAEASRLAWARSAALLRRALSGPETGHNRTSTPSAGRPVAAAIARA
jgi:carboxymethylenebutenolidase